MQEQRSVVPLATGPREHVVISGLALLADCPPPGRQRRGIITLAFEASDGRARVRHREVSGRPRDLVQADLVGHANAIRVVPT